jgi:trans-2-enoyl-CoA reductase
VAKEGELLPIPKMDVRSGATFKVNPPTAYRLLHDFVQLTPADVIIQNAANSGVGQAVIQIARAKGVKTINVVRPRPDLDQLKARLQAIGADYVVTQEELTELLKRVAAPKLALDCVGGKSTVALSDALAPNGTLVTYGSTSMEQMEVSVMAVVFKGVTVRGFWLTQWFKEPANRGKVGPMFGELAQLILEGKLKPSECDLVPFRDFEKAFTQASKMKGGAKQILLFEEACVLKM